MFKYNGFPSASDPIYDFLLDENGDLVMHRHYKYVKQEHTTGHAKYTYRIHTGAHIVTKTEHQMDRYLNGHLYTLDPDKKRARAIILEYYQNQAEAAQAALDKANAMLALMRTPAMPFAGGTQND